MNIKKCKVKDCLNKYYAKGLCGKHYQQMLKFGFIQKRTKADLNEFIIEGDICRIFLYNNKSEKILETIIDVEDWDRCKPYKWYGLKDNLGNYYVRSEKVGWLAPFILKIKTNNKIVVDHIDNNTLDNRKKNLQKITHQENCIKKRKSINNISGHRGVHCTNNKKWHSQISFNGKRYYLGIFSTKEEAALVYNEKAKELFGKFAVLNKI